MSESALPACSINAAIRRRRLKSAIAVTMASRFVVACVNRMTSLSSWSGISTVVFMRPILIHLDSYGPHSRIPLEPLLGLRKAADQACVFYLPVA